MMTEKTKFSAYVPTTLYLDFTEKARRQHIQRTGQTRGAIATAVAQAMRLYLNDGDGAND